MVSKMKHKHSFPADRYGTPLPCRCGIEAKNVVWEDIKFEDGEKHSKKYKGVRIDSFSTPRWNQGLGCYTTSIRNSEKIAKSKGLEPIGDCPVEKVFKPKEETSSRELAHDMIKHFRSEHRRVVV